MHLHRIREVRRRQEVTVRTVARHLGITPMEVSSWERPDHDIHVSDLIQVAKLLGVPPGELLVSDDMEEVWKLRGLVLRLARIVNTLLREAPNPSIRSLAQSQRNLILKAMPQAGEVGGLLAVGKRRTTEDCGRCAENAIHLSDWGGDPSGEVLSQ